jgi:hypothetical protein
MRSTVVVALALLTLVATAGAADDPQDFAGSWKPPSSTGSYYRITNVDEGEQFVGRLTDGDAAVGLCEGAPNGAEPPFWTAKQEGSLNGGGTYDGHTYIFRKDAEGDCFSTYARAKFWPLVANRLRICPAPFDAPDSEPQLDTTSSVDESETCTDFVRTQDPVEPQDHVAKDYIGKIFRDENTCPTDYNVTLRYVADDPMNLVKLYGNRGHGFKRLPNNKYFIPNKNDAGHKRILDLRLVKHSPITIKAKIRTQSGKHFSRKKHFGPC